MASEVRGLQGEQVLTVSLEMQRKLLGSSRSEKKIKTGMKIRKQIGTLILE